MMQKFMVLLVCFVTLTIFSSACGDSEAEPVTLQELPQKYGEAVCQRAFSCCSSEDLQALTDGREITQATCAAGISEEMQSRLGRYEVAIQAGRMAFDAEMAGECVSQIPGLACTGVNVLIGASAPACEKLFKPLVEDGGECGHTEECRDGRCVGAERDWDGVTELGTCVAYAEIGESCEEAECKEGAICKSVTDSETGDSAYICAKPSEIGEACEFGNCVEGAYCDDTGESASNTCKALEGVGGPCTFAECADGLACTEQASGETVCATPDTEEEPAEVCMGA